MVIHSMKKRSEKNGSAHRDLGLERIVFFSDAVMAIAITLLTVELKLPELPRALTSGELLQELSALTPRMLSFLISFMVISIYWVSHHRYFSHIMRYDGRLIGLNLIFLLSIAMMPFVAGLMGQYYYLPVGGMVYAGAVALAGFSMSAIWGYASREHRLVEPDLDDRYIRIRQIILLVGPSVFLMSIPLALVSFPVMIGAWWLSPILSIIILRSTEGGKMIS
jgi:uncharacterized membrane protein